MGDGPLMNEKKYLRLILDDYSAASFTSFNKPYFGTWKEIHHLLNELDKNKRSENSHKYLLEAFRAYEAGQTDVTYNCAYQVVPFLVPAELLHSETIEIENHEWEHLNTWRWPYNMRCDKVTSEHLWFKCETKWIRAFKAEFSLLRYENLDNTWSVVGNMLWGFPGMLSGDPAKFYNVLAEPEKFFASREELEKDWREFTALPDPDYTEFCNDIFGDG